MPISKFNKNIIWIKVHIETIKQLKIYSVYFSFWDHYNFVQLSATTEYLSVKTCGQFILSHDRMIFVSVGAQ